MLKDKKVQFINFLDDVFSENFRAFLLKEDMYMVILSKEVSLNNIIYYI